MYVTVSFLTAFIDDSDADGCAVDALTAERVVGCSFMSMESTMRFCCSSTAWHSLMDLRALPRRAEQVTGGGVWEEAEEEEKTEERKDAEWVEEEEGWWGV